VQNFQRRPSVFCTFSVEPLVIYNCVVELKSVAPFWDIRLANIQWPWNPGYGSLKVIENYTIQSGTHDFLLTFHSNHRPTLHRFRDKRRYPSKIANIPHPRVFNAPDGRGYPCNLVSVQGVPNASMTGLPVGRKSFKIGLVVLIQYRLWRTDRRTDRRTRWGSKDPAYYVARLKSAADADKPVRPV